MENFTCSISHNRIDCNWTHYDRPRSQSFTLDEITSLEDITDNACVIFPEDDNGDLQAPVNLIKEHYKDPSVPFSHMLGTIPNGVLLLIPFRNISTFQDVAVFQCGIRNMSFYKHWYQPIVAMDALIPPSKKELSVFVKAMLDTEFVFQTCHMNAVLQNANSSKDCSNLLSKTAFTVAGEASLIIDTSGMKNKETYVLRVFSEYSRSFSAPACSNTILRVRSEI